MNIVILKERMNGEGRVALTPLNCLMLTNYRHTVFVESGAGELSGYSDKYYRAAGATIVSVSEIVSLLEFPSTVVLKVKQPLPEDDVWFTHMKNGVLFAYFHSTGEKERRTIDVLLKNSITAISYENIQASDGTYPILTPMSEIAGHLATEWGLKFFHDARERSGKEPVENRYICMMVVGAGTVGFAAIQKGIELGFSSITVFEKDATKEKILYERFPAKKTVRTQLKFYPQDYRYYEDVKKQELANADLLVGAVLVPGGHAPTVVSEEQLRLMQTGKVIVDVACDQGGCVWYPKNEEASVFQYHEKTFCRTPNMPGSVPRESTPLLTDAIFPYLLQVLDNGGTEAALKKNFGLRKGILTHEGAVMNKEVALYWNELYRDPEETFGRT